MCCKTLVETTGEPLGSAPDLQEPDRRFTYFRLRRPFRWALSGCGALDKKLPVCTENLVRIDLMRESLNVGHDGRADISLRAGLYKDRANKANVKIGQRKCHITST